MSPVFTSGKLKGMLNLIDGALDNLINNLEKEVRSNPVIDMRPVLQALTMNAIGLTAFGVDLQSFEKPNNPIFKACKDTFTNIRASNVATSLIFNLVMGLEGIQKYMDSVPPGFKALWDYSLKIMKERELGNFKNGDFVDRLLEMKATILKNGIVTEEQLAAQGMIFFLAGFETTAHSMGILLYFLSKNPEAYDILEEEIDGLSSDKFDHGDELPYLEACIKEAMRLIPSVGRYNRKCTKDWEYNGIKIKKGTCIGVMAYVIHHNQGKVVHKLLIFGIVVFPSKGLKEVFYFKEHG
jgi:cytochrome P450 family 3 subfamily A